jgi:nitroimidazol reductase NimA-like FMN-containing flavoprotein (pyridoxamine 5'-phosphate oxidase superfamily)
VTTGAALHRIQEQSYSRAGHGIRSSWPPEQAMSADELGAFLDERRYCILATTTAHGHPQARPVAFSPVGESLWFATGGSERLRNLERTPWVSVVVSDGDRGAHRAVTLDGPVTIVAEPPADVLAGWERRFDGLAGWAVAWFELRPERVFSYAGA